MFCATACCGRTKRKPKRSPATRSSAGFWKPFPFRDRNLSQAPSAERGSETHPREANGGAAGNSAASEADRAADEWYRKVGLYRGIQVGLQGSGNGVLGGPRIPAGRRSPLDRLERHSADEPAVRETLHRGARADGNARRRSVRVRAVRYRETVQERAGERARRGTGDVCGAK